MGLFVACNTNTQLIIHLCSCAGRVERCNLSCVVHSTIGPTSIIILMKNEFCRVSLSISFGFGSVVADGVGCDEVVMVRRWAERSRHHEYRTVNLPGLSSSPVHPQSRIHQRTTAVLTRVALWLCVLALLLFPDLSQTKTNDCNNF